MWPRAQYKKARVRTRAFQRSKAPFLADDTRIRCVTLSRVYKVSIAKSTLKRQILMNFTQMQCSRYPNLASRESRSQPFDC